MCSQTILVKPPPPAKVDIFPPQPEARGKNKSNLKSLNRIVENPRPTPAQMDCGLPSKRRLKKARYLSCSPAPTAWLKALKNPSRRRARLTRSRRQKLDRK